MKATFYKGNQTIAVGEGTKVSPKDDEVRIKVAYSGICGTDLHIFHGVMDQRVKTPQIVGHECSGIVDEIGDNVAHVKLGDKVVVRPLSPCGDCPACNTGNSHICYNLDFLGIDTPGAMQSYWTVPADTIHKIPDDMDLKFGALIEPLAVACHDVSRAKLQKGEKAVVIGGGPIGILVALAAQSVGAEVLISEVNEYRLGFANDLGIKTVNPMKTNLVEYVNEWTNGAGADVAFEVSGSKPGAMVMTDVVRTRGRIVVVAIFGNPPEINMKQVFWREIEIFGARVYEKEDYERAIALAFSGKLPLDKMITKVRPLEDLQEVLKNMTGNQQSMKILMEC